MYFDLTDEQQAIKSTARDFLAARYKSERIRELAENEHGFEQSDWEEMAELGWPGLALPEEWGGQGLGVVDLAVLFEEMGYARAPSPLLSTTVAGLALAVNGTDEQYVNGGFDTRFVWGYDFSVIGRPRELGAGLSVRF